MRNFNRGCNLRYGKMVRVRTRKPVSIMDIGIFVAMNIVIAAIVVRAIVGVMI